MRCTSFVLEIIAYIDCLSAVFFSMGLFLGRVEDVGILRPCGENDIRNLGLEPEMSVFLGTETPLSIVWGVYAFAESHLIVVVL